MWSLAERPAHSPCPADTSRYHGTDGALCFAGMPKVLGFALPLHLDAPLFLLHGPVGFLLMSSRSTRRLGSGENPWGLMGCGLRTPARL